MHTCPRRYPAAVESARNSAADEDFRNDRPRWSGIWANYPNWLVNGRYVARIDTHDQFFMWSDKRNASATMVSVGFT